MVQPPWDERHPDCVTGDRTRQRNFEVDPLQVAADAAEVNACGFWLLRTGRWIAAAFALFCGAVPVVRDLCSRVQRHGRAICVGAVDFLTYADLARACSGCLTRSVRPCGFLQISGTFYCRFPALRAMGGRDPEHARAHVVPHRDRRLRVARSRGDGGDRRGAAP